MTAPSHRLKLTLAYDGRPFQGWQSQPGGNTVQDHLETALREIAGGRDDTLRLHASGRTDTGVHAIGQVAHFDAPAASTLDPRDWQRALNAKLSPAIRVLACDPVDPGFHARFSATGKTYRYEIDTAPVLLPHRHGLAWHLPRGLDIDLLEHALGLFAGEHDFRNFAAFRGSETEEQKNDPATTTRTIYAADLVVGGGDDGSISLVFRGSGFLYKMVRLLTGAAVHVAKGRESIDWLRKTLKEPADMPKSAHCAPAAGLFLVAVAYPGAD